MPSLDPIPEFDLYAELGVALDADRQAIEQAWRKRVRATHPDRTAKGNDRAATERTARLNVAREWLTDPERRARYDHLRRPASRVELPEVDPLATRTMPRTPPRRISALAWLGSALVSLVVLLATVQVGIGTNGLTIAAFALSLILGLYFGLLALFAVVAGSPGDY